MNDMYSYLRDSNIYRMYPEIYHRLYPKIHDCVSRYVKEKGDNWEPSQRELEDMIDEVYRKMMRECPEIDQDLDERKYGMASNVDVMQRPFYGRRRLFRDLIGIIILGSLLDMRRRRPFYGYSGWYY